MRTGTRPPRSDRGGVLGVPSTNVPGKGIGGGATSPESMTEASAQKGPRRGRLARPPAWKWLGLLLVTPLLLRALSPIFHYVPVGLLFWGVVLLVAARNGRDQGLVTELGTFSRLRGALDAPGFRRNLETQEAVPQSLATGLAWTAVVAVFGVLFWIQGLNSAGPLLGDNVGFMERARAFDVNDARTMVHPFYNLGYPALLSSLEWMGAEYLDAARAVTSVGLGLLLLVTVGLTFHLPSSKVRILSVLGAAALLSEFTHHAGTDIPATVCQLAAVLFALRGGPLFGALTGLGIGLGFLFRHQALLVAFPAVVLLAATSRGRHGATAIGACLGTLVSVIAPQLVANHSITGEWFYSKQVQNIRFALVGDQDWYRSFPAGEPPSLLAFLQDSWLDLVSHMVYVFAGFEGLAHVAMLAVVLVLVGREKKTIALLGGFSIFYIGAMSVGWNSTRFVLPALLALAAIGGYYDLLAIHLMQRALPVGSQWTVRLGRYGFPALIALHLGPACPAESELGRPTWAVASCLERNGNPTSDQVAELGVGQLDLRDLSGRSRFRTLAWADSFEAAADAVQFETVSYVVVAEAGANDWPNIWSGLSSELQAGNWERVCGDADWGESRFQAYRRVER